MKFYISPPPQTGSAQQKQEDVYSWLYSLSEQLNVVLANLGYENMNREVRKALEERNEQ